MPEPVYVRFDDEELDFVERLAKEDKITRSEAIKRLVGYATKKLRIEKALNSYKEGKCTIREAAETAGLRYFEFFEILAKENLIGTSAENIDLLMRQVENIKS
ncbi:hypothetical protein HYU10_02275 [Candidatus Woesearchaeota archaeon]|nr:hypothetical protein [Candidatus Woesearchaeota archaeon]MBI2661257.1 hypothetical protein [Candidatus Woesearchaeota archaeon]